MLNSVKAQDQIPRHLIFYRQFGESKYILESTRRTYANLYSSL